MKIEYTYEEPGDTEKETYTSIEDFIEAHPMFCSLLEDGREKFNVFIRISIEEYPAIISVEVNQKG